METMAPGWAGQKQHHGSGEVLVTQIIHITRPSRNFFDMNRTIKEGTFRRYHYGTHDELRARLQLFVDAYNYGRRLKAIRGLTPYEAACQSWTKQPQQFKVDPSNDTPRLNI